MREKPSRPIVLRVPRLSDPAQVVDVEVIDYGNSLSPDNKRYTTRFSFDGEAHFSRSTNQSGDTRFRDDITFLRGFDLDLDAATGWPSEMEIAHPSGDRPTITIRLALLEEQTISASDFVKWVADAVNEAPENYRSDVIFSIRASPDWDGGPPALVAYYARPESDEEVALRTKKAKADSEAHRKSELNRALKVIAKHGMAVTKNA